MDDIKIDKYFAALKLIEVLLEKGLINHETYANIMKHSKCEGAGTAEIESNTEEKQTVNL